jgi:hypothetical protein
LMNPTTFFAMWLSLVGASERRAHHLPGVLPGCFENYAFSTWPNSSSTGVARPKMVTDTRSFDLS